jgi:hypothetical protein
VLESFVTKEGDRAAARWRGGALKRPSPILSGGRGARGGATAEGVGLDPRANIEVLGGWQLMTQSGQNGGSLLGKVPMSALDPKLTLDPNARRS